MPSPKPPQLARARNAPTKSGHFENIEWLIGEGGAIHVGRVASIDCIASAADEHICYAMLARRDGESLLGLLLRLDQSIAIAAETSEPIDEINGP